MREDVDDEKVQELIEISRSLALAEMKEREIYDLEEAKMLFRDKQIIFFYQEMSMCAISKYDAKKEEEMYRRLEEERLTDESNYSPPGNKEERFYSGFYEDTEEKRSTKRRNSKNSSQNRGHKRSPVKDSSTDTYKCANEPVNRKNEYYSDNESRDRYSDTKEFTDDYDPYMDTVI